jgi:DNA primase
MHDAPPPDEPGFQEQFQRRPFKPRGGDGRRGWKNQPEERPSIRGWGRTSEPGALTERELLRALLVQRGSADAIAERIGADGFRVPAYGRIFNALMQAGEDASVETLAATLDEETVRVLQDELLVDPESIGDPTATIAQALNGLRIREINEEMEAIERQRQIASDEEKDALNARAKKLRDEMRALGGKSFRTQGFRKRRA